MADPKGSVDTLDALFGGKLKLVQSRMGYRFSMDAVLLARFATVRAGDQVVDLGTGIGVVSLILAYLNPSLRLTGVEVQETMVERARKNIVLNQLEARMDIICADVRHLSREFEAESFSVVVSNPPYRRAVSGRISPDAEKKIARHEIKGALEDFLKAGAYLLARKGRMALVYPALRSVDLLTAMRGVDVEPKRVRMVHSFVDAEASLVLVEGVKGGRSGTEVLSPLVVYEDGKQYTAEVEGMLSTY